MMNFFKSLITKFLFFITFIFERYLKNIFAWISRRWGSISQLATFISHEIQHRLSLTAGVVKSVMYFLVRFKGFFMARIFILFQQLKLIPSIIFRVFFLLRTMLVAGIIFIRQLFTLSGLSQMAVSLARFSPGLAVLRNLAVKIPMLGFNAFGLVSIFFITNGTVFINLVVEAALQLLLMLNNQWQRFCDFVKNKAVILRQSTNVFQALILNQLLLERLAQASVLKNGVVVLWKLKKVIVKMHYFYLKALGKRKVIVLMVAVGFIFGFLGQRRYCLNLAKTVEKSSQSLSNTAFPFSSKVLVHLTLDSINIANDRAWVKGILSFSFNTGTECLDLLKQFEFNSASLVKKHFITTQNDLVTTTCIFDLEMDVPMQRLYNYYPFYVDQIILNLQNRSLFAQECNFITDNQSFELALNVKNKVGGILAANCSSGSSSINFGREITMECPSVVFDLYLLQGSPFVPGMILLLLLFLIILSLPLLLLNTRLKIIINLCACGFYLVLAAMPYFFIPLSLGSLWTRMLLTQLPLIAFIQCLYVYSSYFFYNKITRYLTMQLFSISIILPFLFWFLI